MRRFFRFQFMPWSSLDGSEYPRDPAYTFAHGLRVSVGVFNLFNSHDAAANYYYTSRLPGEPADGVAGLQTHPLEPRSVRVTLGQTF